MGTCVSVNRSRSNGEAVPTSCREIGFGVRKRTKKTLSEPVVTLHRILSVPNRIVANGKTRRSCLFTQQGRKGINQDAMVVWEDFIAEDVSFFGVFDGHGPHGHLVARKVRDALPVLLLSYFHSHRPKRDKGGVTCFRRNQKKLKGGVAEKDGTCMDKLSSRWREAFFKSYKAMDKELRYHPTLDCFCSGSTAVTVVKQGSNLFMGYIGDSRAILGSKDINGSMVAIQLTIDLKPDLPREAERIQRCKGRVFPLQDEPEVPRVWLPFDDAPGLAMARAFGDFCLKEYGVISTPKYSHRILTEKDQFIVLASDGVSDVLSNQQVVDILSSAPTRSSAAKILVDTAVREWKLKYATSKIDDCSVVCIYLDGKMDSESYSDEQGVSSATHQNNHPDAIASDDSQKSQPSLQRKDTLDNRISEPSLQINPTVSSSEERESHRGLQLESEGKEETQEVGDENWSGLEGVTRVNSFVQLPGFLEEKSNPYI